MLLSRKQDKLYVFKPQFKTTLLETAMELQWNCNETAMKLQWNCNETANRENKLMIENKTS